MMYYASEVNDKVLYVVIAQNDILCLLPYPANVTEVLLPNLRDRVSSSLV